jgi:hypothetical protein
MNIMSKDHYSQILLPFLFGAGLLISSTAFIGLTSFPLFDQTPAVTPTPTPQIATPGELLVAKTQWELSAHADTFDSGMGANTTCARCKSPRDWDPSQDLAAQEALDCGSCKRIPGAPRPELEGGVPVSQGEWQNIQCNICHVPIGDSFSTDISFWDQTLRAYVPVQNTNELCAKCHEGRHGFEVVEEQAISLVHREWECTRCHGPHGRSASCTDCHDPGAGSGAVEHARHPSVNCTACHDNGGLSIWQDSTLDSQFFGKYISRRFAHTLTSWPSHNLTRDVICVKCHHPRDYDSPVLVGDIGCPVCHPDGAALFWCINFPRDPAPDPDTTEFLIPE